MNKEEGVDYSKMAMDSMRHAIRHNIEDTKEEGDDPELRGLYVSFCADEREWAEDALKGIKDNIPCITKLELVERPGTMVKGMERGRFMVYGLVKYNDYKTKGLGEEV